MPFPHEVLFVFIYLVIPQITSYLITVYVVLQQSLNSIVRCPSLLIYFLYQKSITLFVIGLDLYKLFQQLIEYLYAITDDLNNTKNYRCHFCSVMFNTNVNKSSKYLCNAIILLKSNQIKFISFVFITYSKLLKRSLLTQR